MNEKVRHQLAARATGHKLSTPGAAQVGRSATPSGEVGRCLRWGLPVYLLTSTVVVLGVMLGHAFFRPGDHRGFVPGDLLASFAAWDGGWYSKITAEGYAYDPRRQSRVAFFPVYPYLGGLLTRWTGWPPVVSLLLISHLCLAGSFVLLAAYTRRRFPGATERLVLTTLYAFGLWPATLFLRMAHTEAIFLLLTLLTLYGMERQWPAALLAGIVGLLTGVRPVGVALIPSLVLYSRHRSDGPARWVGGLVWLVPLASWGLVSYILFLSWQFEAPWAFVQTQTHWGLRGAVPFAEKLEALLSFEPIWSVFDPQSPAYWRHRDSGSYLLFSYAAANPVLFSITGGLILAGWSAGWVSHYEGLAALFLLLIPYASRSYEMCMAGGGRFAAVAVPLYPVLGQVLIRVPPVFRTGLFALSAWWLGIFSAMFACWYWVF